MNAYIDRTDRMPLWAAFGAPLIGVPLLVALLAVGTTRAPESDAVESSVELVAEPLDLESVDVTVELPSPDVEALARS